MRLLIVVPFGRRETGGAGSAGDHFENRVRGAAAASAASAEGRKNQVYGRVAVDRHVFPGPAIGVDERRLAGNNLTFAAAEASAATTAARRRERHHAGDPVDAHHPEV